MSNTYSRITGEDIAPYRLVKNSSGTYVYADAGDTPEAINNSADYIASGQQMIGSMMMGGLHTVVAAKAMTAPCQLYTADDGRVTDLVNGASIGYLFQTANGSGSQVVAAVWGPCGGTINAKSPANILEFTEHFTHGSLTSGKFSESAGNGEWLKTSTDTDADSGDYCNIQFNAPGGILRLTCNDANGDQEQINLYSECFKPAVGNALYFETSLAIEDVDKCDWFAGLCVDSTDVLGGVTDRMGFECQHDGNIDSILEQDSTEYSADTTVDISDCASISVFGSNKVKLAFYWDGIDTVKYYVDGTLTNIFTDNGTTILVPDDETLTPTFQIHTDDGAGATQTMWIDYVYIAVEI